MIYVINGSGTMSKLTKKIANDLNIEAHIYSSKFKETLDEFVVLKKATGIIDFSHPNCLKNLLEVINKRKLPCVIATTGYTQKQLEQIEKISKVVPICQTYNTSIGIAIMEQLILKMNEYLKLKPDIEITETHHNKKVDAPSGSAIKLYNAIKIDNKIPVYDRNLNEVKEKNDIGINSLRISNVVGKHSVLYGYNNEIIEIKHEALSKEIFAEGAINLLLKLENKEKKLYSVIELIGENHGIYN